MRVLLLIATAMATTLAANAQQSGPGDPTRVVLTLGNQYFGMAAAPNGDLFILEAGRARILRLTPAGDTSVFVSFDHTTWQLLGNMVFDRSGSLLAAGFDSNQGAIAIEPPNIRPHAPATPEAGPLIT